MFEIKKNSPPPKRIYRKKVSYPFKELDINDSFEAPLEYEKSVRALASRWGKILQRRFVVSREQDKVIVWRVE